MLISRISILIAVCFIIFFCKGLSLDPDLGWHLATGKYVLTHGFPSTDQFSYSMPSYPIIFYAWLTDVLLVGFYNMIGMFGLAAMFAVIALASLLSHIPKRNVYLTVPLLLSASILLFTFGIRAQVVSWLLFSLLLVVLKSKTNRRYIFLPIIFILWANIHGSFVLGLGVLALYLAITGFQQKKLLLTNFGIGIACVLATLINPYGLRLWQETFAILLWSEKHALLLDWFPGIFVPYIPLWIMIVLSAYFLFRFSKEYLLVEKVIYAALLAVGMTAIIDIPYFAIFTFPLLIKGFTFYQEKASPNTKKQFLLSKNFLAIVMIIISLHGILLFYDKPYPEGAVKYLQTQSLNGNVFADFNWGGYLLWNLPQKKVFIDGQMTHWKHPNPNKSESINAFQEYLSVANREESIENLTKKYGIDTLVLPPGFGDMQQNNKSYPAVSQQLKEGGWKIKYKDATAVIYRKS